MRLKTLNGAPVRAQLDFSGKTLLSPDELASTFGENTRRGLVPSSVQQDEGTQALKWRRLAAPGTRLRSGWSQPYLPGSAIHGSDPDLSFSIPGVMPSSGLNGAEDDSTVLDMADIGDEEHSGADDFAHHSLIFHDTLVSSQVAYDSEMEKTWSSFSSLLTSFDTATTENSTPTHGENQIATLPGPSTMAVTPLGSLPDAKHIRAIYPQTPTPNLVCVLTSPAQRREVFVKKGGYRMDLCEITVADNTKSGFKVSFWFRPSKGTGQDRTRAQGDLLSTLSSIRVGDVLLLRNIALNVFRDDVYGQSLNPSITRARTSIEVLKSGHKVSTSALGAMPAAVVATFMSVRRWANSHVAPEQTVSKKRKGEEQRSNSAKRSLTPSFGADEDLPPDTMEPS